MGKPPTELASFHKTSGTPPPGNRGPSVALTCTKLRSTSLCVPCTLWVEFHPGASTSHHAPSATPDPKPLWSFPSRAWCPAKHSQQDSSASFLEKTMAFFSWAWKMQTNNLLHLRKPKAALCLGWPVFQLPLRGSWEGVHACGGGEETQIRTIVAFNKSFETGHCGRSSSSGWKCENLQLPCSLGSQSHR